VHQFTYTEKGWRERLVDVDHSSSAVANMGKSKYPNNKPVVEVGNPRLAAARKAVLEKQEQQRQLELQREEKEKEKERQAAAAAAPGGGSGGSSGSSSSSDASAADAVEPAEPGVSPYHFRLVLSPGPTPAVKALLLASDRVNDIVSPVTSDASSSSSSNSNSSSGGGGGGADASGKVVDKEATAAAVAAAMAPNVGDSVEMSPLAIGTCEDIALRIIRCGGAALLVDYGENVTQQDSLRAYRKHEQVNILSQVWHI
jgi:hypothetical protein